MMMLWCRWGKLEKIMMQYAYVNAQLVRKDTASLPITDLAILRGYGIFDFFLLQNGRPLFFDAHWERLQASAHAMRLAVPFSKENALEMIVTLHAHMPYPLSGVRITLTGGNSADGYSPGPVANSLVTLMPLQAFPELLAEKGIALMTYAYQRPLPQVKTIDYTIGILLLPQAKQNGFDEILFIQDGKVSESPRSNVFAVTQQGTLITPNGNVLNGITRMRILQHAATLMPVEERDILLQELCEASEVWISSTTKGIWPVRQIDQHVIGNGTTGPVAKQLYRLLLKEMHG